jgi:flagellar biogenesis protein FliO
VKNKFPILPSVKNPAAKLGRRTLVFISSFFIFHTAFAEPTNAAAATAITAPALPDAGLSLLRVFGALALVIGLFLGGVWLVKNWQRMSVQRGRALKLNILETRSLGGRHAVSVVGYEQERFLIATSPAGVSLLSHLPTAAESETSATEKTPPPPSFAQALTQVLKGK